MEIHRSRRISLFSVKSPKVKKAERSVRQCADEIAKIRAKQPEMLVMHMLQGHQLDQKNVALVERYFDAQVRMRHAVRRLIQERQKVFSGN